GQVGEGEHVQVDSPAGPGGEPDEVVAEEPRGDQEPDGGQRIGGADARERRLPRRLEGRLEGPGPGQAGGRWRRPGRADRRLVSPSQRQLRRRSGTPTSGPAHGSSGGSGKPAPALTPAGWSGASPPGAARS